MSDRLAQLMKLHEQDPQDAFCLYGIALEHAKRGNHQEAVTWLDRTIQVDSQYCYAYYQKSKALAAIGQTAKASETLKIGMVVAKQSGDDHAWDEMAQLLETMG